MVRLPYVFGQADHAAFAMPEVYEFLEAERINAASTSGKLVFLAPRQSPARVGDAAIWLMSDVRCPTSRSRTR